MEMERKREAGHWMESIHWSIAIALMMKSRDGDRRVYGLCHSSEEVLRMATSHPRARVLEGLWRTRRKM